MAYKHLLTNNQRRDIQNALQTGSGVRIQPTRTHLGNGFWTILSTIGTPLVVELAKKITGSRAPRVGRYVKQDGHGAPRLGMYEPPHFVGTWEKMRRNGRKKKKWQRSTLGAQIPIQKYTSLRNHTVKPKFHTNIPISNHDLLEWCRYLNIPIKSVLARNQSIPHNHK